MPNDKQRGLYEKYIVERTDEKPIKDGCIVLEWDDENSRLGIKAFSIAVRQNGYIELANDLDQRLRFYGMQLGKVTNDS